MHVSLQLSSGHRDLALPPSAAELLAFMALRRDRYFSRTALVELVGERDEGTATVGSISTALWRLRNVIEESPAKRGDYLAINRHGGVGLNGPAPVHIDITEFETLVAGGLSKAFDTLTEADCSSLRTGVASYRDDALADFNASWALRDRERLRTMFLDATARLMRLYARQGNHPDAIHYGRLVLGVDPLREDVHRDLMRYLAWNGQRALALRQFETCRAALQRDLVIRPMPETMALYRDIANGAIGIATRTGPFSSPRRDASLASPSSELANGTQKRPAERRPPPMTHVVDVRIARTLIAEVGDRLKRVLDRIQR